MSSLAENLIADFEAEQAVIASVLFDSEVFKKAVSELSEDDFNNMSHKFIFNALKRLDSKNSIADIITLKDELLSRNELAKIGGLDAIVAITNSFSTSAHYGYYADILKQRSFRRKCLGYAKKISKNAQSGDYNELLKIIEEMPQIDSRTDIEDVISITTRVITDLQKRQNSREKFSGLETGFIDLDLMTGGLQKSDLIILAGRPSMGKTAFALNVLQNIAKNLKNKNKIGVMFSLEMSSEKICTRLFASKASIPSEKFRNNKISKEDWVKMEKTAEAFENDFENSIFITDSMGTTPKEIRAALYEKRLKSRKEIGFVIIDYLQLMHGEGQTRDNQISYVSRNLKKIAKEFACPIIALSQLSRACESRQNHRPMLSDLRDSGGIEQDADLVMFLYRDEYYHQDTKEKNIGELIIAKHREGEVGTIKLFFDKKFVTFKNL